MVICTLGIYYNLQYCIADGIKKKNQVPWNVHDWLRLYLQYIEESGAGINGGKN